MTAIIDAAAVLEDIDLPAARADLEAEVDKVIALAIEYLPTGADYTVDREDIIAAVQEALA